MKRISITKNFFLDEYIPIELYMKYHKKPHILIGLLNKHLVISDQMLRDYFGPITINNWWLGLDRNNSGIRMPNSSYYSPGSQHTYGNASDKIVKNTTSDEVNIYIEKKWTELGISAIEENVEWNHTDCRYIVNQSKLYKFSK